MGASASNSRTISATYGSYTLSVTWSESNASTETNHSKITASATFSSGNTAFSSNYNQTLAVYWFDNNTCVNGYKIAEITFTSCGISPYGSRSADGSVNVGHKSDGTLQGFCRAYLTINNGGGYAPASGTYQCETTTENLEVISRASVPTVMQNPLAIGSSGARLIVKTNRKSTSFTHTVKVECGSWSWQSTARSVTEEVAVNIPYSVVGQFDAHSKSKTATVTCWTFNGTTSVGDSKTCSTVFTIDPATDYPYVSSITIRDTNPLTYEVTRDHNTMIANISHLSATITIYAHGDYTILSSAIVRCGGKTENYVLSGDASQIQFDFDGVNDSYLTVTVRDWRDDTVSETKNWTLIPYQPVTATASVKRTTPTGDEGTGKLQGMAYTGTFGSTPNSLNVTVYFGPDMLPEDAETFNYQLTGTEGYHDYLKDLTFQYAFDFHYQYDVYFIVRDLFSRAEYTATMTQGLPIISWDENDLDVWGNLHVHRRLEPNIYQDVADGFDAVWEHEGVKNLLDITGTTITRNGVTFTVNTDGTVATSGTATANTWITLGTFTGEAGKEYILNGCPSGGSDSTWCISLGTNYDTGDGVTFTGGSQQTCTIGVFNGHAVNNLIFKPMIRDARIGSPEYVTPHKHEVYSTDEKYIGQYLGVPLFRKTLYIPTISGNSTTVAHSISGFYDIVRTEMTWYDTQDRRWFSNIRWDSASVYYKLNSVDATNVYFGGAGTTWSSRVQRVRITLEYIRT